MEKQKIYLDESNRLVVNTNKGVVEPNNTSHAVLDGEFVISASDVAKLLTIINNDTTVEIHKWWLGERTYRTIQQSEIEKENEELRKKHGEAIEIYNIMNAKIEKFNKSRHWWERKFEIGI